MFIKIIKAFLIIIIIMCNRHANAFDLKVVLSDEAPREVWGPHFKMDLSQGPHSETERSQINCNMH